MELLLTKNPIISSIGCKAVKDYYSDCILQSDVFNIATGFISNQSLAELRRISEIRSNNIMINIFIGMHCIKGFTKVQYNALKSLNTYFAEHNSGNIYLSPSTMFHSKMYSFLQDHNCLGAFVGSSNLDSFVSAAPSYIESDILFNGDEATYINNHIYEIFNRLGVPFDEIPTPTDFIPVSSKIFDSNYEHVREVSEDEIHRAAAYVHGDIIRIPLKTEKKSNLNTSFGKGKIKGKYSPRDWFEVEIILSNPSMYDLIPTESNFTVITNDGYSFDLKRQGSYYKNLRSASDLRILGRWIKQRMINEGAIEFGQAVTPSILDRFGKHFLVLQKTSDNNWYLKME